MPNIRWRDVLRVDEPVPIQLVQPLGWRNLLLLLRRLVLVGLTALLLVLLALLLILLGA